MTHGGERWAEIADIENWIADCLEALALLESLAEQTTHPAALRRLRGMIDTRRRRLRELRERRKKLRSKQ